MYLIRPARVWTVPKVRNGNSSKSKISLGKSGRHFSIRMFRAKKMHVEIISFYSLFTKLFQI